MDNNRDIELLDNYIRNTLSDDEKAMLQERLAKEEDLRIQLDFLMNLPGAIRYQQELELREFLTKNVTGHEINNSKTARIISLNRYFRGLSIAAILIVTFFIWQPNKLSDDKVFQQHFSETPVNVALNKASLEPVSNSERSITYKFKNYSTEETDDIFSALDFFKQNKYNQAKEQLKSIWHLRNQTDEVAFYLAICQMKTGEITNSIKILGDLQKNAPDIYPNETAYYLGLCYIKAGERAKAKIQLKKVAESNSTFASNARSILDDLRWF